MKKSFYTLWFFFLKSLTYIKRGLLWTFKIFYIGITWILKIIRNIIGLRFYRLKLSAQKITGSPHLSLNNRLGKIFGNRLILQILLFAIFVLIMYPQSHFFQSDDNKIPGRETLLYKLVGPGNQDFSLETVSAEIATSINPSTDSWRQGAVVAQPNVTIGSNVNTPQDIAGVSAGGLAFSKPIIMPGANLPTASNNTGRTEIIYHTVQSGEVIGQIAEKYGLSLSSVLWANGLTSRSLIKPGDKLKILPISGVVHKVKKGDNLSKIAKLYGADINKILEFNKLKSDGSDLVVGEELLIPDGKMPAPTPTYTQNTRQYTVLSNVAAPPPSVSAPAGSGYLWPAGVRYISQYFGWRHTGLDIAGKIGTPLYATKYGTVTKSQCGWNGGYGCYIIIDHGGGISSLYGHASKLYASVGDVVEQGETIALMGSTGRSTGSHLHFEIRINGVRQNPLKYIR